MAESATDKILEDIYASLHNNNEGIDSLIVNLKAVLASNGEKSVTVDASRLPVSNREGRKTMQIYFKKRGVTIDFASVEAPRKAEA